MNLFGITRRTQSDRADQKHAAEISMIVDSIRGVDPVRAAHAVRAAIGAENWPHQVTRALAQSLDRLSDKKEREKVQ